MKTRPDTPDTVTNNPNEGSVSLEDLAKGFESDDLRPPVSPEEQAALDEEAARHAQGMAAMQAAMQKMALGIFRVTRSIVARKLPEIRDEWTDPVLQGPADALIPLAQRYAGALFSKLGDKPELAVFCLSLVPLTFGYMDALERHEKNQAMEAARTVDAGPVDHG